MLIKIYPFDIKNEKNQNKISVRPFYTFHNCICSFCRKAEYSKHQGLSHCLGGNLNLESHYQEFVGKPLDQDETELYQNYL